jgi:hypothetical protein
MLEYSRFRGGFLLNPTLVTNPAKVTTEGLEKSSAIKKKSQKTEVDQAIVIVFLLFLH